VKNLNAYNDLETDLVKTNEKPTKNPSNFLRRISIVIISFFYIIFNIKLMN
jgi:hypothetical protein